MTRVRLLATVTDPRDPAVVYGAGHEIDITDEATLTELQNKGVLEVLDVDTPPGTYNARVERPKTPEPEHSEKAPEAKKK